MLIFKVMKLAVQKRFPLSSFARETEYICNSDQSQTIISGYLFLEGHS